MSIALHLCGGVVKDLIRESGTKHYSEDSQRILNLAAKFGRVQLNTHVAESEWSFLEALIQKIHRTEKRTSVILQWNDANAAACKYFAREPGFECLVDSSGGRGITPRVWPKVSRYDVPRIGNAGGLHPGNVQEQLALVAAEADGRTYWIDAEGKLRDAKDQLDLNLCERFLALAHEYQVSSRLNAGAIYGRGYRNVDTLKGLWLDWWVAKSQMSPVAMVTPPKDACKAVLLDRAAGTYESYCPSEDSRLAVQLLSAEQIALLPLPSGRWTAHPLADRSNLCSGETLELAGLRAIVKKHFGATVPRNPWQITT